MPARALLLFVLLSSICAGSVASAAPATVVSPSPRSETSPGPRQNGDAGDAVTRHTLVIDGQSLAYTARAGSIVLRNDREQETARVFYTAATLDGADNAHRAITFVYNGGPGSSTMWLRMGSFGPVRVIAGDGTASGPPPYRIVDNPYSLLDKTDLVFIDLPGSGFGRLLDAGKPKDFYGVDQDVAAFGQFITRYLSAFDRWNSPKFLFGESYGTTRSGALAAYLNRQGVTLNGIVLLSSILNYGLDFGNGAPVGGGDWAYVFYLPTEAATAWYHNAVRNKPADLASFLASVERFAMTDYVDALTQGDRLDAGRRQAVARRLSDYTGLSVRYILDANLRVDADRFRKELLRDRGIVVGRLDGRYQTFETDRALAGTRWDPTESSIAGPYTTANNQYLRDDLKYQTSLEYRSSIYRLIFQSGGWDLHHNRREPPNVAPDLSDTMTQNPRLLVFSANGYYDFATPYFATVYTLKHLNLAAALQKNITYGFYESGHMVYLSETALPQFKRDLARWYDAALAQQR